MFLWPIFEYVKANKWAQIALLCLAAILTLGLYLAWRDNGVKQRTRAQFEVEKARERAKMLERKSQIITEERDNADAALAARDHGEHYPDYASLPDDHKAIAEGRAGNRGPNTR